MANKRMTALLIASVLLLPVAANARCVQADLQGEWQVYAFNNQDQWVRCKLRIGATGGIANTTCTASNGQRQFSEPFTQGSVKLANPAACTFTAQWKLGPVSNKVVHATLSQTAKDVGSGIGDAGNAAFVFDIYKVSN